MPMIVITGGIGAGKSTALRQFQELGAHCADADEVAHRLYAPGTPLLQDIARLFGQEMLKEDGSHQLIRRAETPADYFATFDFSPFFKK